MYVVYKYVLLADPAMNTKIDFIIVKKKTCLGRL